MPYEVLITADYAENADETFQGALHFDELRQAMADFAAYEGFPDDFVREGETYHVTATFWGFLKVSGHVVHVEELDVERRILRSHESGNGIKRWDHTLSVQPYGEGSRWEDRVVIDAGWRSWFVARFAAFVYARRHRKRQALAMTRRMRKV